MWTFFLVTEELDVPWSWPAAVRCVLHNHIIIKIRMPPLSSISSAFVARSGVTVIVFRRSLTDVRKVWLIVARRSLTEIRNSGFRDRRSLLEIKERQSTVDWISLCLPYLFYFTLFTYLLKEPSRDETIDQAAPLERRETCNCWPNSIMLPLLTLLYLLTYWTVARRNNRPSRSAREKRDR